MLQKAVIIIIYYTIKTEKHKQLKSEPKCCRSGKYLPIPNTSAREQIDKLIGGPAQCADAVPAGQRRDVQQHARGALFHKIFHNVSLLQKGRKRIPCSRPFRFYISLIDQIEIEHIFITRKVDDDLICSADVANDVVAAR